MRAMMLIALVMVGVGGCETAAPAILARELPAIRPACEIVPASDIGNCDVSPWTGDVDDQYFELYSSAGGTHLRASVSRAAPQGVPVTLSYGTAAAWDWTHACEKWSGTLTWRDVVSHDPVYTWVEHHEWSVSVDATCVDDGYRLRGDYRGWL